MLQRYISSLQMLQQPAKVRLQLNEYNMVLREDETVVSLAGQGRPPGARRALADNIAYATVMEMAYR